MRKKLLIALTLLGLTVLAVSVFRRGDNVSGADAASSPEERAREARRRRHGSSSGGFDDDENDVPSRDRLARRAERERARHDRFVAQFEILSLGPTPTAVTPDAVLDAMHENDAAFEDCIEAAGGREAYLVRMRQAREAIRLQNEQADLGRTPAEREAERQERINARHGRPTDRVMRFNVRPDGTVDPETIELEPQVPEPFGACFISHIASMHLENVGNEGASVEMPLRGPRRRVLDGGIPPL